MSSDSHRAGAEPSRVAQSRPARYPHRIHPALSLRPMGGGGGGGTGSPRFVLERPARSLGLSARGRHGTGSETLTLTRLERAAGCSRARRGGELQSPNHEQGALAGCPGSGPGGAENTSPATRPTSGPLWEIPRGAAWARNHRREQRGPRGAAQLLAARPAPSTGVKRSGEWQRLICVQKREIFRSVARYN